MAGYGIPETDIATVLEIDPRTLRKHYRRELDKGHIKATATIAGNLCRMATGTGREAVTATIFWLKTRASWKETVVNEVRHEVGPPARGIVAANRLAALAERMAAEGEAAGIDQNGGWSPSRSPVIDLVPMRRSGEAS